MMKLSVVFFAFVVYSGSAVNGVVQLETLSTLYLPYTYDNYGNPSFELGKISAEQMAHDPKNNLVYVVGDSVLHVVDISNVYAQQVVHHVNIDYVANDIEVCGNYVAMTVTSDPKTDPGRVDIYDVYDYGTGTWNRVQSITVGSVPDMLQFTKDCKTIIVCNEGEHGEDNTGHYVDPEGSISILRWTTEDLSQIPKVDTADFTEFNAKAKEYVSKGVRAPLMGQLSYVKSSFSQNMEPEYAAFNENETIAYIGLQENNAIATVDMTTSTITEIYPLGFKNHNTYSQGLDASDKDGGSNIQNWPVYGMYQPDSIKYINLDGRGIIVTANEGADMEVTYGSESWSESMRGEDFYEDNLLSDEVSSFLKNALADKDDLGRLQFSKVDGRNANDPDKFDNFFAYGGRSFSVIDTTDMSMIYDSGDNFERITATVYPTLFNMNGANGDFTDKPEDTMDEKSDNKGPSPESLAYGKVGNKTVVFIGLETISSIMIYDISNGNVTFESVYRAGQTDDQFEDLYHKRIIGDSDPEDLRFIDGEDSPTGKPILLVAGSHSGTISIYDVIDDEAIGGYNSAMSTSMSVLLTIASLFIAIFL